MALYSLPYLAPLVSDISQSLGRSHMEFLWISFLVWGLYLVPLLPVAGPIWFFGRRRVQWCRWDFAVTLMPYIVWMAAMFINARDKSLSNLVEAFYLGCATSLVPIIRVLVGQRLNQKVLSVGLLVMACMTGIVLWAFAPGLPE
jgi:hypothetical protein